MINVKAWLDKEADSSRTARSALNKGRTLQPQIGDKVHFDPICRLGKWVAKYRGDLCEVIATAYEAPDGLPNAPPQVRIEFGDDYRYWVNPWHLTDRFDTGPRTALIPE